MERAESRQGSALAFLDLNRSLGGIEEARTLALPPPAIQGAGASMQVELRDGSFDLAKLQGVVTAMVTNAQTQSSLQRVMAPFRSSVPQYTVEVDRVKTQMLHVTVDQVF